MQKHDFKNHPVWSWSDSYSTKYSFVYQFFQMISNL